jgi:hypothetical protein
MRKQSTDERVVTVVSSERTPRPAVNVLNQEFRWRTRCSLRLPAEHFSSTLTPGIRNVEQVADFGE